MNHEIEAILPTAPPPVPRRRILADVREAIGGSSQDYTEGPIGRALLLLAVPMVLETVLESFFALSNIFWVSRLGADAVTTVGLTESMLTMIYTVAMGLGIGVTAMVARRIGEKDHDGAARTAVQAVVLGFAVAGVLSLAGTLAAPHLLALMGASPAVVAEGSGYTRIMFAGNATILLLFLLNAAFRGAGDAAIAMRVLWLANGINIVLDPLLIFGWGPFPQLGIDGAAVATNIGRGTAVLVQLWTLARVGSRVRVYRRHLGIDFGILKRLVALSATGTFQIFVATASWVVLTRIVAGFGTEVVAGYTIAIRVIVFAILPAWGLSNAAATMVGQALGAGKPERGERSVWIAGFTNLTFLGVVGIVFAIAAPMIAGAFTSEPMPIHWAVLTLRIVSIGFAFYGFGMVVTQAFNGAGDPWTPTFVNLGCFWAFEIPAAFLLSREMGPTGVFLAIAIAESSLAVVSGLLFRRGRWKRARA